MGDEDWLELFEFIEQRFSARGLDILVSVDEENYRDMVIETLRLLYIDLRNTNRNTAQRALELISVNVSNDIQTDHFLIGARDAEEPSEADRIVKTDDLPENSFLQQQIRKFVLDLGGPDFGNDPGGGFSPGGGPPPPFGGFDWQLKSSRDFKVSGEHAVDQQTQPYAVEPEGQEGQEQHLGMKI